MAEAKSQAAGTKPAAAAAKPAAAAAEPVAGTKTAATTDMRSTPYYIRKQPVTTDATLLVEKHDGDRRVVLRGARLIVGFTKDDVQSGPRLDDLTNDFVLPDDYELWARAESGVSNTAVMVTVLSK